MTTTQEFKENADKLKSMSAEYNKATQGAQTLAQQAVQKPGITLMK